jgi:hypothetical protein
MKPRDVAHAIEKKVPGDTADGKERNRWAIIDGVKVLRVTYPNSHSADIKKGTLESIRKQLKLNREEFEKFIQCTMSGSDYVAHLRTLLESGEL